MRGLRLLLLAFALLAGGLAAGFSYAYSISVMPGLDAAPPAAAIRAMPGTNAVIRSPVFAAVFFGALLLPLAAGLACLAGGEAPPRRAGGMSLAAAAVYGGGVVAVTFAVNLPMNEALAALGPAAPADPAAARRTYSDPWTAWNDLRAVAATVAAGLSAAALAAARPAP